MAAAAARPRFFKPEHVFLIAGHGEDTGRRFDLHEGQYGAIPTQCGRGIFYDTAEFYDFFTSHSDSSTQIPIPDEVTSLKETTLSIVPTAKRGDIPRPYKVYRPKVAGNSEKTRARWTMPELMISPFSFWSSEETKIIKIPTLGSAWYNLELTRSRISLSGVFTATAEPSFSIKGDSSDANISPERKGFDVYPYYEKAKLRMTIEEAMAEHPGNIMGLFFERLEESMSESFIPFDHFVLIAWLDKINRRHPRYSGKFISFDKFNEIISDEMSYDVSLSVAQREVRLGDLIHMGVPLSFIYDYIASKLSEPFLVLAPVCRGLPNSMTRREKARVRRYSRNFSGNVLGAAAAKAAASEGGRRGRKTRRRRRST